MPVTLPALPDRYVERELIEHGGMADVYRARDSILGRTVAVKVLAERYAGTPNWPRPTGSAPGSGARHGRQ